MVLRFIDQYNVCKSENRDKAIFHFQLAFQNYFEIRNVRITSLCVRNGTQIMLIRLSVLMNMEQMQIFPLCVCSKQKRKLVYWLWFITCESCQFDYCHLSWAKSKELFSEIRTMGWLVICNTHIILCMSLVTRAFIDKNDEYKSARMSMYTFGIYCFCWTK